MSQYQYTRYSDSMWGEEKLEKSDPMKAGLDMKTIRPVEELIVEKKERLELPSNYDVHNSIQLLPQRVIDTTNKSVVIAAEKDGFDPDGFRKGEGLQKEIFYMNPYISCQWCNRINFVDVMAIRHGLHLPEDTGGLPPPVPMPPCLGCGRADGFEIGSTDYIQAIKDRERELAELRKLEIKKAIVIQKIFRQHLRRRYGYTYTKKALAQRRLVHRAANLIQSMARVRLARRRIRTERYLVIIKTAHSLLLRWALKPGPGRINTFWYPNKNEERLVYMDYIELCNRKGFIPARMTVEKNIAELATRIRNRQHLLITLVQKRYRGVMARRVLVLYAMEKFRYLQWQFANILKLQALYRGYKLRLQLPEIRKRRKNDAVMRSYKKYNDDCNFVKGREWVREVVRKAYKNEREEEKSCRFTGRIGLAKDYNGRKMRAFADSVYADNRLETAITDLIHRETDDMALIKNAEEKKDSRKKFMVSRIGEHGPRGFGYRGFAYSKKGENAPPFHNRVTAFLVSAVLAEKNKAMSSELHADTYISSRPSASESLTGGGGLSREKLLAKEAEEVAKKKRTREENALFKVTSPSRSRGMKALFQTELDEILAQEVEQATHNFSKKNVCAKLRAHNKEHNYKNGYKYPKDVNVDPLQWLNDDIDTTIKYQDRNLKKKEIKYY